MFTVREERDVDAAAIRGVHEAAFDGPTEAGLVDALRDHCADRVSFIAERDGAIVGHVLLTPIVLTLDAGGTVQGMGLAPIGVLPEHQRQGVGSALTREALSCLRARACPFVIVLGHPSYYPRFGFEPAASHGIRSEWDVPPEAFMVLLLDHAPTADLAGVARYRPEFAAAM